MQDRFKLRAWNTEEDRYASDDDICYDTSGSCDDVYDLTGNIEMNIGDCTNMEIFGNIHENPEMLG